MFLYVIQIIESLILLECMHASEELTWSVRKPVLRSLTMLNNFNPFQCDFLTNIVLDLLTFIDDSNAFVHTDSHA